MVSGTVRDVGSVCLGEDGVQGDRRAQIAQEPTPYKEDHREALRDLT